MNKIIVSALSALTGAAAGTLGTKKAMERKIAESWEMSDKHLALFLMMNQWVKVKQEGKNLACYFEKEGFREIGIYGMSSVGETLVRELDDSDIIVKYGIDQRAQDICYEKFSVVSPESELEDVDAIIVTSIKFFDEIEEKLRGKVNCPVISLEDILYEVSGGYPL